MNAKIRIQELDDGFMAIWEKNSSVSTFGVTKQSARLKCLKAVREYKRLFPDKREVL